ncbi:hypothetical protein HY570_01590 [Candidatus Micrarchaeota archaeon]|nr:hypothetical protein [Candidatus Micrarchaeota archaeon]
MGKVVILIAAISKKLSKQLKHYPFFKISKNTFVFPLSAKKELAKTVTHSKYLFESDFPDEVLDQKNNKIILSKNYSLELDGSKYRANFKEELAQLQAWFQKGTRNEQSSEYRLRLKALKISFKSFEQSLFDTKLKSSIPETLESLEDISENDTNFKDSRSNLRKISHTKDDNFAEKVLSILERPTSLTNLSRKLELKSEYVRNRLNRLIRTGKVKRTEKLGKLGRPPYVYYLSQSILNY